MELTDAPIWSCSLERNVVYAATASADCTVKIWRGIEHEDGLPKVLETHQNPYIVRACAFWETIALDLLIRDINGHISIFRLGYDQASLYTIQPVKNHDKVAGSIRAVGCLSPNTFVSTYSNMTGVRFWDSRCLTFLAHKLETRAAVPNCEVSRDETSITLTGIRVGVQVLTLDNNQWTTQHYLISCRTASLYKHPRSGNIIAARGDDGYVHLYDHNHVEIDSNNVAESHPIQCVRFSPTERYYASGHKDHQPKMTRVRDGLW
ncbi:serine-threonine kinase receptor-associated protein [Rosa chinensis]|nr:serine-threonine kinase receptor-associated protein [Rosa chinensis]